MVQFEVFSHLAEHYAVYVAEKQKVYHAETQPLKVLYEICCD